MNWRQRLLGVPVLISSHASPAHRGRIGPIVKISGTVATVDLSTNQFIERATVDLRGLRFLRKKEVACGVG